MVRLVEVDDEGNPVRRTPVAVDGVIRRGAKGKYTIVGEAGEPSAMDVARAGAAGVNRGFFADLAGLPVDTMANVIDLAKAAGGMGYHEVTGKSIPEWLEAYDRREVPGSSEWIASKLNAAGLGSAINNPAPQSGAGRIAFNAGRVGGASVVPNPRAAISGAQNLRNFTGAATSGAVGGAVGEVSPEYAMVASMSPAVLARAASASLKGTVRGGEAGRRNMEQRIQDLANGGVKSPSVGLASGNPFIMGVENILSQTPGSVGLFARAQERNLAGMLAKSNQIRDELSPVYGPVEAGNAIQSDLKGAFKDRIGQTYGALNDRFAGIVPPDRRFAIDGTLGALDAATAINPLAPNTTGSFVQPRISQLRQNILQDTTVQVPGMYANSTRNSGLPLNAIKDVRTSIGKEAASRAIMGTPEQAEFKQLYGGLSRDMQNAARVTDMDIGPQINGVGPAQTALKRANAFYSKAMGRADELHGIANRDTPEGAYSAVAKSLDAGPTVYQRLRGVVKPETRQKIVATLVDEMGAATPGQQNADGSTWSPRTFLTNYNRLDPKSKVEMFKRMLGGDAHAKNLSDIAKAAEMLGDGSKIWANPSGTGANLTSRATFGALTFGAFFEPITAATVTGGLASGNLGSRLLLNPTFANWLAKGRNVRPQEMQSHLLRLTANAKLSSDAQFQSDVQEYVNLIEQSPQQERN